MADPPHRLVLCVGNPDRGDDGIGRLVAQLLRGRVPAGVVVAECAGEAAEVLDRIAGIDCVFLVDAAVSGAPVGTVHRLDCAAGDAMRTAGAESSHGLGLAEAVALARTLRCLPRHCVAYAVEGLRFGVGDAMSTEVADAARDVAEHLLLALSDVMPGGKAADSHVMAGEGPP